MFIDEPALQCREPRAAQSPEMQDDGCGNLNRTHEGTLGGTSTEHERLRTSTNLRRRRRQQYCTVHAAEGLRASRCMNPNGRKQQSTEHERLRRDGSSIQLMCTSTGRHEGCWKRMGVLIHMCANVLFSTKTDASKNVHPIHGSSNPLSMNACKGTEVAFNMGTAPHGRRHFSIKKHIRLHIAKAINRLTFRIGPSSCQATISFEKTFPYQFAFTVHRSDRSCKLWRLQHVHREW